MYQEGARSNGARCIGSVLSARRDRSVLEERRSAKSPKKKLKCSKLGKVAPSCKRVSSFITDATDAIQRPLPHRELHEAGGAAWRLHEAEVSHCARSLPAGLFGL